MRPLKHHNIEGNLSTRDDDGNGIPNGNGNPMGFPWEWELVTRLGMGRMGRNGNRLHGNGREWGCKKPFPVISTINKIQFCFTNSWAQAALN